MAGGAFLPPHPAVTSVVAVAPQVAAVGTPKPAGAGVPKLWVIVVATGAPKLLGCCPTAGGGVYVVPTLGGKVIPPLLAPASFSCVRPYAARPSTAPMLM